MRVAVIRGNGWIGKAGDIWSDSVVYIKLKDCKDDSGFDAILAANYLVRKSDIYECTMKHRLGYHPEYGDGNGYWEVCDPSERGACKMMYAAYGYR